MIIEGMLGNAMITIPFFNGQSVTIEIVTESLDAILKKSDFISMHVPKQEEYIIAQEQFEAMKDGVGIINAARGGVIDEVALVSAIDTGKVRYAGLDVFESDPTDRR